jgi:hypothetical protein
MFTGRFRSLLCPSSRELSWRKLGLDLWSHLRLRFAKGDEARSYNLIQKYAYLFIIFVVLPRQLLTGLALLPWMDGAGRTLRISQQHALDSHGLAPDVRYIGFESYYDGGWDSIDLFDAFHPQTVLTYEEFPGTRITWTRGAPLRLCAPLHYGYKWIKGIKRVIALENLDTFGDGTGMGSSYASKGRTWSSGAA